MGFSLKKTLKKVEGGVGSFFGGLGKTPGPSNPYAPTDWSRLLKNDQFDYLKDATSKAYAPVKVQSENLFQDYIRSIQAPSSVDDVRRNVETEQVQNLLRDIGRDTASSLASAKLDYADRGLSGPGQMSDIESIGLARIRGQGEELGAKTRLSATQAELDRLKAREEAARSAYGQRYATGTALGTQEAQAGLDIQKYIADLISGREMAAVSGQGGAYQGAQTNKYQFTKASPFEDILRNVQLNIGVGK